MTTGGSLSNQSLYDDAFQSNCGIDFADLMAPTPNTAAFFDALTRTPRPPVDYGILNSEAGLAKIRSGSNQRTNGSTSLFAVPHSGLNYDALHHGRSPLPGRNESAETSNSLQFSTSAAASPNVQPKRSSKRQKPIIESISQHPGDHGETSNHAFAAADTGLSGETSTQHQQNTHRQTRQFFSHQSYSLNRSNHQVRHDDYQLQPSQSNTSSTNSTFDSLNAAQQQEDAELNSRHSSSGGENLDNVISPPNSGDSVITTHCMDQSPHHSSNGSHKHNGLPQYDSLNGFGRSISGQNVYVLHPPLPPVVTAANATNSPLPPSYSALTPLSVYSTAPLSVPSCQDSANNIGVDHQQKSQNDSVTKAPVVPIPSNRLACKISELADNLVRLVQRGSAETQLAGELACDLRMSIKALVTTAQILLEQMRQTGRSSNGVESNNSNGSRPVTPYSNPATINRQSPLSLVIDYLNVVKDVCKLYRHTPPEHVPEPTIAFIDMLLACILRSV